MKSKKLFCLVGCLAIFIACKKNATPDGVITAMVSDSVEVIAPVQNIDKRKEIIKSFEKFFIEECKKWPVSFHRDTTGVRQSWTDNLGLSRHDKLKSSEYILFVDKGVNERSISIETFTLADEKAAAYVIKEHCDGYRLSQKNGSENDFIYENVYAKIPYFAFRVDSIIFEITATNTVGHIMHNVVEKLRWEYSISRNDVIPCDREYIPQDLAKKLKPALSKWLKYYNADISDFYRHSFVEEESKIELYNEPFEEDTTSLYYRKYDKQRNDVYQPMLYDYSPNKRYYLTVRETKGVFKDEDGRWYYYGGDDCQEIYLVNRNSKKKVMVMWLGVGSSAEAAFWADDKTYAIVGQHYYSLFPGLFIWIGGIYYHLDVVNVNEKSYFVDDLKQRGVITEMTYNE